MALVRRMLRSGAAIPLRLLPPADRATVLEALSASAIVDTPANGRLLRFYAPSPLLRSRAEGMLSKEPDTIAWLDGLGPNDVVWDIGANVGVFSLYAATRGCRVLALEPAAANFFALTRNVELNGLAALVTPYCVAIAGVTELGVINLDSIDIGAAMSQFGRPGERSRYSSNPAPPRHGMVGISIDDFAGRFGAPAPTALKIDVDGLEWPILQGGRQTLSRAEVRSVLVELSVSDETERNQAIVWLRDLGLHLSSTGQPQGAAGERAANHLFVRRP
jgi:FkbM family methyltransferase